MTTGTSNSSTLMRQLGNLAIVIAYLLFIPMVVLQDLVRLREFPAFEDIAEEESSGNSSSNQTDDKRKEFDNFKKNVDVKNAFGASSYLGLYQVDVDSGGNVTFKLGVLSNCQDVCGWQFKVGLQCVHAAVAVAVFAAFVSISTRIYLFQGKGEINKVVFFKTASAELASGALLLFGMFLLMLLVSTMAVDTAFGVSVYLGIASGLAYMLAGATIGIEGHNLPATASTGQQGGLASSFPGQQRQPYGQSVPPPPPPIYPIGQNGLPLPVYQSGQQGVPSPQPPPPPPPPGYNVGQYPAPNHNSDIPSMGFS
ncbi:unnamed protein product [Clavelina lepadiformis]|uniref:Uncharacterized protein n=1 Tax=Clavelina lepadiformis TaxID=159417 RepID=A0ABP0GJB9_CLALP